MPTMPKPHMPTLGCVAIGVVILLVLYHFTLGKK